MLTASLIFLATLALVIWQPRGLGIGWSAALGALASLLAGTVALADIPRVWSIVWNASATLIGLIVMTMILDEAGLFRWAALRACRADRGHRHALFLLFLLLVGGSLGAGAQVRVGDASMVNRLEALDEHLLGEGDVAEGDRALLEETILYLTIDEVVHQVADAFLRIFLQ